MMRSILVAALDDLRASMYERFTSARSSALLLKLVDSLFMRPATSITDAANLLGITHAAAAANIAKFVEAGLLREITGRTRDRVYVARSILNLMSDHDGAPARPKRAPTQS